MRERNLLFVNYPAEDIDRFRPLRTLYLFRQSVFLIFFLMRIAEMPASAADNNASDRSSTPGSAAFFTSLLVCFVKILVTAFFAARISVIRQRVSSGFDGFLQYLFHGRKELR